MSVADLPTADDLDWRAVREEIGMSGFELSNKLGCNLKTIRRWERGEQSPSIAYQRQMRDLHRERTTDTTVGDERVPSAGWEEVADALGAREGQQADEHAVHFGENEVPSGD